MNHLKKGSLCSVVDSLSYLQNRQQFIFRLDWQWVCVYKQISLRDVVWHAEAISIENFPSPHWYGIQNFRVLLRAILDLQTNASTNEGVGLRPLACCDRGFESHRGHGCLSVVSVVCFQVEVSATDWSLVQRSSTYCGASLCVIKKPRTRGGYSPNRGL